MVRSRSARYLATWFIFTIICYGVLIAAFRLEATHCEPNQRVEGSCAVPGDYYAALPLVQIVWIAGSAALISVALVRRPRNRSCPECGRAVDEGVYECPDCHHDFSAAAMLDPETGFRPTSRD